MEASSCAMLDKYRHISTGLLIWRKFPRHFSGEAGISASRDLPSYIKTISQNPSREKMCSRMPRSRLKATRITSSQGNMSHMSTFPRQSRKIIVVCKDHKLYSRLNEILASPGKSRGNFLHISRP